MSEHGIYANTETEALERCKKLCKAEDRKCKGVERRGSGVNVYQDNSVSLEAIRL